MLYNETKMEPVKFYYDTFEKDGTYGMIAIYQYEGDYSENDNCQVWYSNGKTSKNLFEFVNTSKTMSYCNVIDSFIYNDSSGRPYVILSTWQRVSMSWNCGKIFGLSDKGSIEMIFEVSGDISVEEGKILVHEYYPQPQNLTVPESSEYEICIVDGSIVKKNEKQSSSGMDSSVQIGVVATENDDLNVREMPSIDSEIINTIPKGETVRILSEENDWYRIEINGRTGYVLKEYVAV